MLRPGIITLLSSIAFVGPVASLDPRAYENYADGKVRGGNWAPPAPRLDILFTPLRTFTDKLFGSESRWVGCP